MKTKLTLIAVVIMVAVMVVFMFINEQVLSRTTIVNSESQPEVIKEPHKQNSSHTTFNNRIINNNPNDIPTQKAYILLFRFFAKYNSDGAKKYSRGHLRHIGLGNQPQSACPNTMSYTSVGIGDEDIDAFIEVANNFNQKVTVLDVKADEIKDRTFPNPNAAAMNELTALQQQKERLADETIALLRTRLNSEAFNRIESHIQNRVKRLTKKIASPPNPLSPEWRSSPSHNHN